MKYEIDLNEARDKVVDLAVRAGNIARESFSSSGLSIIKRGGVEVVTEVDQALDDFLVKRLKNSFPGTEVMAEESYEPGNQRSAENEFLWIADPLDGSKNYSKGIPYFAVSIALARRQRTVLGVIYKPLTDELYWAQQGVEGAWLNGRQINVSDIGNLEEATFACDWVADTKATSYRKQTMESLSRVFTEVGQVVCRGSSVSDIASIADGRTEIYINHGLKPWDVAAASFLVEKAGGMVTTPDGKPWNIFHPNILATNGILHQEILRRINTE